MIKHARELFGRHWGFISHWGMELVVVMIGVLLALSVQQWAEDRGSRQRAVDAEARIREELLRNAGYFIERIAIQPCLRARVEILNRGLVSGGPDWHPETVDPGPRILALRTVYPVPSRSLTEDAYKGALADGELASVAPERRAELAVFYKNSGRLQAMNDEENALADRLQPLQLVAGLSAQERNAMLATLARLDAINGTAGIVADQYLARLHAQGFRLTPAEIAKFRTVTWPEWVKSGRARYGACWDVRAIGRLDPAILS